MRILILLLGALASACTATRVPAAGAEASAQPQAGASPPGAAR